MQYSPYDLVPLILNGCPTYGRPTAFDSDVTNQMKMTNAFGKYVKPTQISTTCHDCGQGFVIDIKLSDPPFSPYVCSCPICKIDPPPIPDPFINPVTSERISINDLDPLLYDIQNPVVHTTTVAERIKSEKSSIPDPFIDPVTIVERTKSKKPSKRGQKSEQNKPLPETPSTSGDFIVYPEPPKSAKLQPAEGMEGDEIEFNDDDLVEP